MGGQDDLGPVRGSGEEGVQIRATDAGYLCRGLELQREDWVDGHRPDAQEECAGKRAHRLRP